MQEKKKRKINEEKYITRMEKKEEREKRLLALENEYLAEQKTHNHRRNEHRKRSAEALFGKPDAETGEQKAQQVSACRAK